MSCSIEGCEAPVKAHGWCQKHYRRWQRHGDPEALHHIRRSGTVEDRWWDRVDKNGPRGCWIWTGALDSRGYGQFPVAMGTSRGAHRWGYERFVGPVPAGCELDHTCRVHACVRFDHLDPVTHLENVRRGALVKWADKVCSTEGCSRTAKVHGRCLPCNKRVWRITRQAAGYRRT